MPRRNTSVAGGKTRGAPKRKRFIKHGTPLAARGPAAAMVQLVAGSQKKPGRPGRSLLSQTGDALRGVVSPKKKTIQRKRFKR